MSQHVSNPLISENQQNNYERDNDIEANLLQNDAYGANQENNPQDRPGVKIIFSFL